MLSNGGGFGFVVLEDADNKKYAAVGAKHGSRELEDSTGRAVDVDNLGVRPVDRVMARSCAVGAARRCRESARTYSCEVGECSPAICRTCRDPASLDPFGLGLRAAPRNVCSTERPCERYGLTGAQRDAVKSSARDVGHLDDALLRCDGRCCLYIELSRDGLERDLSSCEYLLVDTG